LAGPPAGRCPAALYQKLGFRDIDYYPEGENDAALAPNLRYMQLDLVPNASAEGNE